VGSSRKGKPGGIQVLSRKRSRAGKLRGMWEIIRAAITYT